MFFAADLIAATTWWQIGTWVLIAIGCGAVLSLFLAASPSRLECEKLPHRSSRATYFLAALFFAGIAIYGSFVPWQFRSTDWQSALERFANAPYLNLDVGSRADWVANILLFVPLGFLWMGVATLGKKSAGLKISAYLLVTSACAALSCTVEFLQIWFPPRTVSQNDVLAESLGGVVGGLAWLAVGEQLTGWFRAFALTRRSESQVTWILQLYCLGFAIYSALPMDLTISLSEIARKFRDGKIQLSPFADLRLSLESAYQLIMDAIVFIPVGMLAAIWRTRVDETVRPVWKAVFFAALFATVIECGQVLVYSRYSSLRDILVATFGAAVGAWGAKYWQGRQPASDSAVKPGLRVTTCVLCYLGYVAVLFVVFCSPFDPIETEPSVLRERYAGFYQVPFARLYQGTEFNALGQILRKVLFFAPLGLISCLVVGSVSPPAGMRFYMLSFLLALGILVGFSLEMAQVFLPSHYSDVTDVVLYSMGILIGMLLSARVLWLRRGIPDPSNLAKRHLG
jgi:VanZ family protein